MEQLIKKLANIDLEIEAVAEPLHTGQTPEFWHLVALRVQTQKEIERFAFDKKMNEIVEK